jgi:S1-C subfamily serine protease
MTANLYESRHRELMLPVVRIITGRAAGSGTCIYSGVGKDGLACGYVLTNHHVVDDLIKVEKRWSPLLQREVKADVRATAQVHFFRYQWKSRAVAGTTIEADIMAYDKDEDLALLKLRTTEEDKPPVPAKLYPRGKENDLRVTMPVYCIGAGLGEPPVVTGGFLSQFGQEIENREFWLSTAPGIFGNSGGALFLAETHEFIGVPARIAVTGSFFGADAITHLMYSIPITRVYKFLEDQFFRFIYDSAYTEEGEEAERKRKREQEEIRMAVAETRGEGEQK